MTGIPPSDNPCYHNKPILVASVIAALFVRLIGASGISLVNPSLPAGEKGESPYTFVAIILAQISSFKTRE